MALIDEVDAAFLSNAVLISQPTEAHPRTSWRPLRVYNRDPDSGTTTASVYGYRAACSCGWTGKKRPTVAGCRFDIRQHRDDAHDGR